MDKNHVCGITEPCPVCADIRQALERLDYTIANKNLLHVRTDAGGRHTLVSRLECRYCHDDGAVLTEAGKDLLRLFHVHLVGEDGQLLPPPEQHPF